MSYLVPNSISLIDISLFKLSLSKQVMVVCVFWGRYPFRQLKGRRTAHYTYPYFVHYRLVGMKVPAPYLAFLDITRVRGLGLHYSLLRVEVWTPLTFARVWWGYGLRLEWNGYYLEVSYLAKLSLSSSLSKGKETSVGVSLICTHRCSRLPASSVPSWG